jgi:polysaccharide biosynthesis protein PslH
LEKLWYLPLGESFFDKQNLEKFKLRVKIMITKNKRVLFHAPILQYPPKGGPEVSVINAIKVLNQTSDVYITTSVSSKYNNSVDAQSFLSEHSIHLLFLPSSFFASSNEWLEKQIQRIKRVLAPLIALIDLFFIIRFSKKHRIEVFWIDRVLERAFYIFYFLRKFKKSAFIVGDTEAIHSRFILRELPMVRSPLRYLFIYIRGSIAQRHEILLMKLSNCVTAVSEIDANYYRSLGNYNNKVKLFTNSVDFTDYQKTKNSYKRLKNPSILLMGTFGTTHSPMDRAAKWLAKDIMPLIWDNVPDAHLYIVGKNSDITQSDLNGVNISVIGQVESMLPFLNSTDICVIPLRHESGTRFKIIQAGAAKMACVSTTLGAEGLNVENNRHLLIGDTPIEFSQAVIELLLDKEKAIKIGKALHSLVKSDYGLNVQKKEAIKILNEHF